MKRLIAWAFVLSACGGAPAPKPCPCATGELCVYVQNRATPSCHTPCLAAECAATSCVCGASCPSCKNCVTVCL